jgi:sucrose-6-phosphate hydrolase SacC (GH32 family)
MKRQLVGKQFFSVTAWTLLCVPAALPAGADIAATRNPIWATEDNLRDPSVLKVEGGYHIFYSRLAGTNWGSASSWTIANVFTRDFVHFENDRDVSPHGHASPGDVVKWHGRWILPYQTYPSKPTHLVYAESTDLKEWTAPKPFLTEAAELPWNDARRVIDPTFVVDRDALHCWFVGTTMKPSKANLLGHAVTRDPKLEQWEILTRDAPLLGRSERAPDGVENVMVFRTGDHWTMIYSEGLARQHLALATSDDLRSWKPEGPLEIGHQAWMTRKHGAPFVWRDDSVWRMILMGENEQKRTTFGLLTSPDGTSWTLLPE